MYAVKEVSREEWVFRGLAIAMCLAMVGMAVMPLVSNQLAIYLSNYADKKWERTVGQMLAYYGKVQTDAYASLMTAAVAAGVAIPVAGWIGLGATVAGTL